MPLPGRIRGTTILRSYRGSNRSVLSSPVEGLSAGAAMPSKTDLVQWVTALLDNQERQIPLIRGLLVAPQPGAGAA